MLSAPGFSDQTATEFAIAGYALKLPSKHPLLEFLNPKSRLFQPYRESGLIKIATALERLGRRGTALDIGANVGDSAAILYRHGGLGIVSVEPSDFFFSYLAENIARHFSDRAVARQAFVVAKADEKPQGLYHWGGTARAVGEPFTEKSDVVAISDLLEKVSNLALLKVDIDGLDIELLHAALDGKTKLECPVYFELEFAGSDLAAVREHCAKALALFAKAKARGYGAAFLWDDRGRFFGQVALYDQASLVNALNYMGHFHDRSIWGFDVLLVQQSDGALLVEMRRLLSENAAVPLT